MENTNYTFKVSPLHVVYVIVAILLFVGAHFAWTSIGSLKSQVADHQKQFEEQRKQAEEGKKQAEEAKKKEEDQQAKVDQMWNFLIQATQQAQR